MSGFNRRNKILIVLKKVPCYLFPLLVLSTSAVKAQQTYADNFSTQAYNRNDGNTNWATDWIESGDIDNGPTAEYIQIQSNQLYMYWIWGENIQRTADLTGATSATLDFDYTTNSLGGTQQLGVFISSNGGTSFNQIGTLSGNGSFSQDISGYISSNTILRFAKSDADWNSDDNASIDNLILSAIVPTDSDGDGIEDVTDLDNDNDGILDVEECPFVPIVTQSFTSTNGTVITNTASNGRGNLYIDFISIDNSFNLTINGTDIATEFQFQPGAAGNFARFDTGFTYGQNGVPQLWSMTGTVTNPMLRIIIDADGNLELFGAQSPAGTLLQLTLDTPPVTVPWNPSGSNTISIGQMLTGPTNMTGQLSFNEECDTDLDGILNRFDLDSDNDGIYDAEEAGHGQAHTNGIVDGAIGTDGIPNSVQNAPNNKLVNYTIQDTDGDGTADAQELDADADGCLDVLEAGYTDPNGDGLLGGASLTVNTLGVVTSGTDGYTTPADGDSNTTFDFQEVGAIPTITTQPITTIICPGCSGDFTVIAGTADTYQWQRLDGLVWTNLTDSSIYNGTATATLTITNPTPTNNGEQYRVLLGDLAYSCSQTTSNIATLNVSVATVITNRRITHRVNLN
ncbi:thrombospondin type 3 repeat-containing protein [uncultured Croceitalea sp.]|uniref:thrombospondin type 3 repeat-containing protein n=1 Tax=uncultured Croceitalea sp. TaxID=1798908 RepID=UPI003305BFF7